MNNTRRKKLGEVIDGLDVIQDRKDLYAWINTLDNLKDEEQDYYDNIPENLQYSQRAEDSEAAIDNLDEALGLLNEAYDAEEFDRNSSVIQEAINKIEDARW
ncbi:MAG: hypothetical protein ACI4F7_07995 [Acutalibacteraceae bacterium]